MKLQLATFLSKIKKEFIWLLILILLLLVFFILKWINVNSSEPFLIDFLSLIGFPKENTYNVTCFFIFAYKFILIIYYVYIYYVHDLNYSFENVVLRTCEKIWIRNKVLLCGMFTILMNFVYIFIIYFFYRKNIMFDFKYFLYPTIYNLMATYLIITLVNFFKHKSYLAYIFLLIFIYITFFNFNIYISLLIIVILVIFNMKCFKFKKYYKNIN